MEATKQCSKCGVVKSTVEFYKRSASNDGLQSGCKPCKKNDNEQYRQLHKPKFAEYQKQRRQSDIQFRLIGNLRSRLNQCIKNKSQTTKDLIGIPFELFLDWIKFQLPAGYLMEDLGKILHVDHVILLSVYDLTDKSQLKQAMIWVNLQPLEASKNQSKSNQINPWLAVCEEVKDKYFIRQLNNKNLP